VETFKTLQLLRLAICEWISTEWFAYCQMSWQPWELCILWGGIFRRSDLWFEGKCIESGQSDICLTDNTAPNDKHNIRQTPLNRDDISLCTRVPAKFQRRKSAKWYDCMGCGGRSRGQDKIEVGWVAYANILTLYLGQMSAVVVLACPKIFMPNVAKRSDWRWDELSSVGSQKPRQWNRISKCCNPWI